MRGGVLNWLLLHQLSASNELNTSPLCQTGTEASPKTWEGSLWPFIFNRKHSDTHTHTHVSCLFSAVLLYPPVPFHSCPLFLITSFPVTSLLFVALLSRFFFFWHIFNLPTFLSFTCCPCCPFLWLFLIFFVSIYLRTPLRHFFVLSFPYFLLSTFSKRFPLSNVSDHPSFPLSPFFCPLCFPFSVLSFFLLSPLPVLVFVLIRRCFLFASFCFSYFLSSPWDDPEHGSLSALGL